MPPKPYALGKDEKRNVSADHETRLANELGGVRQPGSGNGPFRKEDIDAGTYLVQHKGTKHKSISIKLEVLREVEQNSLLTGRKPAMVITFWGEDGEAEEDWAIVRLSDLKELASGPDRHAQKEA